MYIFVGENSISCNFLAWLINNHLHDPVASEFADTFMWPALHRSVFFLRKLQMEADLDGAFYFQHFENRISMFQKL
jgi:hypothetical protein